MSMKNSNDTIENQSRDLPVRSAVPQPPNYRVPHSLRAGRSGDRILMEARFSAPVQTGSGAHPASCTIGNRVFPGGRKRPGRDVDPSTPSSAEV
jgi:hypothetical protein